MSDMQRIVIVGSGGAGKSTLARQLSELLAIPVTHLDTLFWQPGWQPITREALIIAQQHVLAHPRWIIDGNYSAMLEMRLHAADTVIFLDMPRWLCLWRIGWRRLRYHGRSRPDMRAGCHEQLTWEFVRFVWEYPQSRRPAMLDRLARAHHLQCIILRSPAAVAHWLAEVATQRQADATSKMRYNADGSLFEEKNT